MIAVPIDSEVTNKRRSRAALLMAVASLLAVDVLFLPHPTTPDKVIWETFADTVSVNPYGPGLESAPASVHFNADRTVNSSWDVRLG